MQRTARVLAIGVVSTVLSACGQEPATCPENLAIDLSNAVIAVYNFGSTGAFTCPSGGSGSVTGTRGTDSYDYMITFTGCVSVGNESSVTLTGMMTDTTNIATHVETAHADALHIVGTETACTASPIDATCVVDFNFTGRDSSGVPTGNGSICGLTFP